MVVSRGVCAETKRHEDAKTGGIEKTVGGENIEFSVLDVRRAHFYARAIWRVFVKMPPEDPRYREEDPTAELTYSLYGTQDAVANW